MISLRALSVFLEEGCTFSFRELKQLLGVSDDHARERRTAVVSLPLSSSRLLGRLGHRLTLSSKTVRVLEDLSRLCWRTLRLVLRCGSLTMLLGAWLVCLWLLSLQNGRLLRCLGVDGLSRKLSTHLLLSLWSLMLWLLGLVLVLLMLLRPL